MKKKIGKLHLNVETIRQLSPEALDGAVGGRKVSQEGTCPCDVTLVETCGC